MGTGSSGGGGGGGLCTSGIVVSCTRSKHTGSCDSGYTYDGVSQCNWLNATQYCHGNDQMRDSNTMCYSACPNGYTMTSGGICSGSTGPSTVESPKVASGCPNGKINISSLCYNECPEGAHRDPANPISCQGSRGVSYVPTSSWKNRQVPYAWQKENFYNMPE